MSSIEALWTVRFGAFGAPASEMNGGVMVLETNRMFGGDSAFAYLGNYTAGSEDVSGSLHIIRHKPDPTIQTLYETDETEFDLTFTGKRVGDNRIEGQLHRAPYPAAYLVMERLSALPG